MNAVMHKYDMTEGADMPANEDNNLAVQVGELRADVRHIQSDVTDLKADFRALRKETGEQFDSVKKDIAEVKEFLASAKIWALGLYFALAGSLLYVLARALKWL
jgi:hypothetical protein